MGDNAGLGAPGVASAPRARYTTQKQERKIAMKIDSKRMREIIEDLAGDVRGPCCEASTFIGEVDGKPVRVTVMSAEEGEENGYEADSWPEPLCCISSDGS